MDAKRYPRSSALSSRADSVIPGGHHLSGRPLLSEGRSPQYFDRAKGCRVWDVDGNEYIDFVLAFGPYILGYADERVDGPAVEQLRRGSLLTLNHPIHVAFVERLLSRFPAADMATFFKTGSEATTAAIRIARRFTGRRRIVRCGYHGWHDWCVPLETFVPDGLAEQVLEFRAREPDELRRHFRLYPDEIAAVIVAPEMVLPFDGAVLRTSAEIAWEHGALFILDEVKTAFRTPPGSVQARIGLKPDLTTVSKALGNGWPIAATLGTRRVMGCSAGMFLSATFHGDTASMVAAMATMDLLEATAVADLLWTKGERLIDGLNACARKHRVPAIAYPEPTPAMPFLRFVHADPEIRDRLGATFYEHVFAQGVLLHPRHLWFICDAHTDRDIERALAVADAAMGRVRDAHARYLEA
jgi:glutamate-1-semialdehyde 2,1-aminomutase